MNSRIREVYDEESIKKIENLVEKHKKNRHTLYCVTLSNGQIYMTSSMDTIYTYSGEDEFRYMPSGTFVEMDISTNLKVLDGSIKWHNTLVKVLG